ncbi:LysR family transcriptional regulator [Pseudomonas mohnii]|jgi:DNA-binding transcriptional LysR family regulator|uniref:LysR family transcriptional regulator n=1 Tax=Pseudomonas TaxID=286 RepID=UPI00102981E7|nr:MULTISPECIES: LysR family transcriptional regulator [Pseudomonas]MBH8613177.1 LysR family transcriptional regulator [Pseudomonas mohnii]MBM6442029.1 LysR family transcriptional regulator [Pseudomonas sp. MIL9]RZO02026.1 LysR family transcriptional regulator [Pseudomonas moorei]
MDKLLALKMFVETVRCGGYSSAARKLGISTSSVTRQVAGLESELGASLLNRTTRNTSVTVAGQHYFDKAVAILEAIEEADAVVADRGSEAQGRLRASVPVEFGRRIIAPHLGRLLDRHPGLEISLALSDEVSDLLSEQIDVSVRLGSSVVSEDIVSKRLGDFQRWVVASPDYLTRTGLPRHPHDLLEHQCLRFDYRTGHHNWTFQGDEEIIRLNVQGRLQSNNADILREAALAGGGVTLLADWLVRDDVSAGRLTRVLEQYEVNPGSASTSINALYLPNHRGSSRINVFIEFLQEILAP